VVVVEVVGRQEEESGFLPPPVVVHPVVSPAVFALAPSCLPSLTATAWVWGRWGWAVQIHRKMVRMGKRNRAKDDKQLLLTRAKAAVEDICAVNAQRVLVFSGSGISKASGMSTFSDPGAPHRQRRKHAPATDTGRSYPPLRTRLPTSCVSCGVCRARVNSPRCLLPATPLCALVSHRAPSSRSCKNALDRSLTGDTAVAWVRLPYRTSSYAPSAHSSHHLSAFSE